MWFSKVFLDFRLRVFLHDRWPSHSTRYFDYSILTMFESDVESQRLNLHVVVAVFSRAARRRFFFFSPDEPPLCLHVFFFLEDGINV